MKKAFTLFTVLLLLAGCKVNYPVAQQSGQEDMAYLLFVSPKQYAGKEVQVSIDRAQPFDATVVKAKKARRHGTQYRVNTGNRHLKVTDGQRVIYEKNIFLSAQEVKQIMLP